jgi:hypothetical protein
MLCSTVVAVSPAIPKLYLSIPHWQSWSKLWMAQSNNYEPCSPIACNDIRLRDLDSYNEKMYTYNPGIPLGCQIQEIVFFYDFNMVFDTIGRYEFDTL